MANLLEVLVKAGINPKHIPAAISEKLTISNRGAGPRAVLSKLGLKEGSAVTTMVVNLKDVEV